MTAMIRQPRNHNFSQLRESGSIVPKFLLVKLQNYIDDGLVHIISPW